MSNTYNLNDNVGESFKFILAGNSYTMKYPLVGELEDMQAKARKLDEKKANGDDTSKEEKEIEKFMYSYITPDLETTPPIEEALKKQNIKVIQNFNIMFKTEFGIEG